MTPGDLVVMASRPAMAVGQIRRPARSGGGWEVEFTDHQGRFLADMAEGALAPITDHLPAELVAQLTGVTKTTTSEKVTQ